MLIKDIEKFREALSDLERKGISKEFILTSLKDGILSAYLKTYGDDSMIEVSIDDSYNINIHIIKTIVENVVDASKEIALEDAKLINAEADLGDEILIEQQFDDFRRTAIQNAKQLIIQRVREAEKQNVLSKFESKKGSLCNGIIRRVDDFGNVFIDLENIETVLPIQEQSPADVYKVGNLIQVLILDISVNFKTIRILISRKSNKLVEKLFEFEIPEIHDGIIKIKSVARDVGYRTKIAIHTDSEAIDPVGACVGNKSARIRSIIDELNGEKIDIVLWNPDLLEFVKNSLKPAEIESLSMNEREYRTIEVKVKQDQLALAVGKKGQNVRLASRLTDSKINISLVGE